MVKTDVKVTRTYSTRCVEKKLLGDVIKANKFTTSKRKRLKREAVLDEETVEVVEV